MNSIFIAPSILSADFTKMGEEVKRMEQSKADLIHCDVMDGLFVPNITFGPKMIADIKKCVNIPLDVHLMIVEPERYIDNFIDAGADYLTVHLEATQKLEYCLEHIKNRGVKCGAVISPDTDVAKLKNYIELCDMVLLMSVYPGFGGQKFIENSYRRLDELVELKTRTSSNAMIEIDGGVTMNNYKQILAHGAQVLVAGNTVFSSEDASKTIKDLKTP